LFQSKDLARILAVGPARERDTQKIKYTQGKQEDPFFLHEHRYAQADREQNQQGSVPRDLEPDVAK